MLVGQSTQIDRLVLLWIPHSLNNSLRTVNIDFSKCFDFMEFPNISINNLKLFAVNVI